MPTNSNWTLEAVEPAAWTEDSYDFTVDGTTYTVSTATLRPGWFQNVKMVDQTRDTVTFDIDTDSTS